PPAPRRTAGPPAAPGPARRPVPPRRRTPPGRARLPPPGRAGTPLTGRPRAGGPDGRGRAGPADAVTHATGGRARRARTWAAIGGRTGTGDAGPPAPAAAVDRRAGHGRDGGERCA